MPPKARLLCFRESTGVDEGDDEETTSVVPSLGEMALVGTAHSKRKLRFVCDSLPAVFRSADSALWMGSFVRDVDPDGNGLYTRFQSEDSIRPPGKGEGIPGLVEASHSHPHAYGKPGDFLFRVDRARRQGPWEHQLGDFRGFLYPSCHPRPLSYKSRAVRLSF